MHHELEMQNPESVTCVWRLVNWTCLNLMTDVFIHIEGSFCNGLCMFQMAPDYDHLTLMEKVEVFEHAVNNTAGDDLAKLLWLKSPSSEVSVLSSASTAQDDWVNLIFSASILTFHYSCGKMSRVFSCRKITWRRIHSPYPWRLDWQWFYKGFHLMKRKHREQRKASYRDPIILPVMCYVGDCVC